MTSSTDSAYCMTSQQPCRYRHCLKAATHTSELVGLNVLYVMGTELLCIQPLS